MERTREHEKWKCESRSLRGPVIGLDGRRIVTSFRGPGREEWCDLSFQKVQFAHNFEEGQRTVCHLIIPALNVNYIILEIL